VLRKNKIALGQFFGLGHHLTPPNTLTKPHHPFNILYTFSLRFYHQLLIPTSRLLSAWHPAWGMIPQSILAGDAVDFMAGGIKDDREMESITRIARKASGRSPLYRWLLARHDVFLALVAETRPSWRALAEGFADLGLLSPSGRPFTAEAVRHTWWRVRRDVAAPRSRRRRQPGSSAGAAAYSPVVCVEPPAPASDTGDALARIRERINLRSGRKT
jgi:hypothetical protein